MERLSARGHMAAAVSVIALSTAIAPQLAAAQEVIKTAAPTATPREEPTMVETIVVGARASQQSSIARKKRSITAQDSIVADDVGSFPDSNINEAMSRVAGVAIERNGWGEGDGVVVRGNGADLTRVELDGMGVAASGANLAVGGGDGRAADLREFPAEMIKSLDVIKGQTADMTPGGLGATVQIQTRTALDFKKPYISVRGAAAGNTLSQKASPEISVVATRKFLDDRLGIMGNISYSKRLNDSHALNNGGSNNAQGYTRFADFDNSPDKTFTYNPATANGVGANDPIASWALASGVGTWNAPTPVDVLTKSAAAQTKAECLSAFPLLNTTQLNSISGANNGANRQAAQAAQINAQISCLNQWNDYTPNLVRDQVWSQYEDRLSWDLRLDYRVNDDLTIFAKYQVSNRDQLEENAQRTRGGVASLYAASNNLTTTSLTTNTFYAPGTPNVLSAVNGGGYYIYMPGLPTGVTTIDTTPGSTVTNNAFPLYGVAANIVPGSIQVDANHHLTQFDITNAAVGIDQIHNQQDWHTKYWSGGAKYEHGPITADLTYGHNESEYSRQDIRLSRSYNYGNATMRVLPNGIWTIDTPSAYDERNMTNFVQMLTPSAVGMPSYSNAYRLSFTPRLVESAEDQAKFDLTYLPENLPLITRLKVGALYRNATADSWGNGGYSPTTGVFVPTLTLRSDVRACQNLPTTTAANACVYGYAPNATTTQNFLYGIETLTQDQLIAVYQNSLVENSGPFMKGYEGTSGLELWDSIDVPKAYAQLASAQNYNLSCIKACTASDGKVYDQPVNRTEETMASWYWMADLAHDLPFGMELQANLGSRMFKTEVAGSGYVNLIYNLKNSNFNPLDPTNPLGVTSGTITKPVTLHKSYTGWLPSYNAALWVIPDRVVARYNWAKTIAPPAMKYLWPGGSCTYDERRLDVIEADGSSQDMTCGTFGNADLKPYQATKNNTSIEWYPNKDTSFSLAYYRQKVRVGGAITVPLKNNRTIFDGSNEAVPGTERQLSDVDFAMTTYANGPGYVQSGWEFVARTAFTFLPWKLDKTGVDFNISTTKANNAVTYMDPLTGDALDPIGQSKYFANLVFWYDDGVTKARIAYQTRDRVLTCVSPCGNNSQSPVRNPPNTNIGNLVGYPYNPSEPYYSEQYEYLDAKISRRINRNFEIYAEGRNLLNAARLSVGSDDRGFDGKANPWSVAYGGTRFAVGFTYRN